MFSYESYRAYKTANTQHPTINRPTNNSTLNDKTRSNRLLSRGQASSIFQSAFMQNATTLKRTF